MTKLLFLALSATLFVNNAQANTKGLNIAEQRAINAFSVKVNRTLISANACLVELKVNNKQGIRCIDYNKKITLLNKYYVAVKKINPKKRYAAIAGNNEWYAAFITFDRLGFVIERINDLIIGE